MAKIKLANIICTKEQAEELLKWHRKKCLSFKDEARFEFRKATVKIVGNGFVQVRASKAVLNEFVNKVNEF